MIGDDGLDGIVLGPGSALGEAHAALQTYALELRSRGVVLAVCSKNDPAGRAGPRFTIHPEMILKRDHIAAFVANWSDKAENLRTIAATLRIGIDALVFVDDNPGGARAGAARAAASGRAGDRRGSLHLRGRRRARWMVRPPSASPRRIGVAPGSTRPALSERTTRGPLTDMKAYLASLAMIAPQSSRSKRRVGYASRS